MLQSWTDTSFNTDWEICNALGNLAKMRRWGFDGYEPVQSHIETLFFHVSKLDQDPLFRADVASVLDHLQDSLAPGLQEDEVKLAKQLRSTSIYDTFLKREKVELDLGIIYMGTYFGIYNYVAEKCEKRPELYTRLASSIQTLVWSMRHINGIESHTHGIPVQNEYTGIIMLHLWLTHGVDPNSNFEWAIILRDLGHSQITEEEVAKSFEGIKLILRHGADIEQDWNLNPGSFGRKVKAFELLKELYDADHFAVLEDIVKRRETKNKEKKHGIAKKMGGLKLWIASKK